MSETKVCTKCGEAFPLTEYFFARDKRYKSGFYPTCRKCKNASKRLYYANHRFELNQKNAEYRAIHQDRIKEKKKSANKAYREKNQIKLRDYDKEYKHRRRNEDYIFKLVCQTRTAIYKSFARNGHVKADRCEKITGLPQDELIKYLIGTYKQNYGHEWNGTENVHIDHIVPISTAKTEEDVMRLCNYTNLQLLKAKDNLAKSNKLNFII